MSNAVDSDVLVLGAGYTGLAAALRLHASGLRAVVLEARERVGGRTLEYLLDGGQRLELGGQYIGPIQDRMTRLVHELGLETFAAWSEGDWFLAEERTGSPLPLHTSSVPCRTAGPQRGGWLGDRGRAGGVGSALPRGACGDALAVPNAEDWDAVTFQTWIEGHVGSRAGRECFSAS
jgi:monoamine oxidase